MLNCYTTLINTVYILIVIFISQFKNVYWIFNEEQIYNSTACMKNEYEETVWYALICIHS